MHVACLIFFLAVYRISGHGEHGDHKPTLGKGQLHISRKMEDHVHDINHLQKDLQGQIKKPMEQLSEEEQNFYYFKLHDTNNDNRLDGLEVIAAFNHEHKEDDDNDSLKETPETTTERPDDDELIDLVDDILEEEDLNHDGYISYDEFKHALQTNTIP